MRWIIMLAAGLLVCLWSKAETEKCKMLLHRRALRHGEYQQYIRLLWLWYCVNKAGWLLMGTGALALVLTGLMEVLR